MIRRSIGGTVALSLLVAASATSAQTLPTEKFPFKSGPVTISSCSLNANGNVVANNSLEVKYFQNVPKRKLASVTFRVRYAGQTAVFTDVGDFSYDKAIDHKFNVLGGAPFTSANPQVCRVLTATFADGETVTPQYEGDVDVDMMPTAEEAAAPGSADARKTSSHPIVQQTYPYKSGPVTISSCSVNKNGNVVGNKSLNIKYFQNVPTRHLQSVTFRVRYGGKTATFTDSGTFDFDAPIDHTFNFFGGAPYMNERPEVCRVITATFGDGEIVDPVYAGRTTGEPNGDASPTNPVPAPITTP
jgi:hypothetical protein